MGDDKGKDAVQRLHLDALLTRHARDIYGADGQDDIALMQYALCLRL